MRISDWSSDVCSSDLAGRTVSFLINRAQTTRFEEREAMGRDVSELFTFDEFLAHWAAERPDRVAMREADRVYSYADLDELTACAPPALIAAGLHPGARLAGTTPQERRVG